VKVVEALRRRLVRERLAETGTAQQFKDRAAQLLSHPTNTVPSSLLQLPFTLAKSFIRELQLLARFPILFVPKKDSKLQPYINY
jgi:hypothetical protein